MELFSSFYAPAAQPWHSALPLLVALPAFAFALRALRRKRLIEDVPTARVMGVFIGLVELKGLSRALEALRSPLAGAACVYYRYEVEEKWERRERDEDGNVEIKSGWKTVHEEERRPDFTLEDDTGAIRIKPEKAEIDGECSFSRTCGRNDPLYYEHGPRRSISHSEHRRRFTEHVIREDVEIYLMGPSRVREDVVEPEIAHREDAELFLISTDPEKSLTFRYGLAAGLLFPLAIAGMAAVPWAGFVEVQGAAPAFHQHLGAVLGWGTVALLVVLATYAVLLFNGLRKVEHRMRQAQSNIDVELKRRHELIPRLVNCVKAVARHECDLQEAVRHARSGPPSGGGDTQQAARTADRQTASLERVMGVAERYPDLEADESFRFLTKTLTRTEKKIGLARNYFNDSVTAFNDRIGTFPDLLLAPLGGYTKAAPLRIRAFEKHPVSVDLREEAPGEAKQRNATPQSSTEFP